MTLYCTLVFNLPIIGHQKHNFIISVKYIYIERVIQVA